MVYGTSVFSDLNLFLALCPFQFTEKNKWINNNNNNNKINKNKNKKKKKTRRTYMTHSKEIPLYYNCDSFI